jgi:hypothetical protein
MFYKAYPVPLIRNNAYAPEVDEPQGYADRLSEIYAEISNNGGEVEAVHKVPVVVEGRSTTVAYLPVIVARFSNPVTNVGKD